MISYLGSLVQSCYGEGGALQTDIAVCGEHSPCSGHTGFAPYRGVCAFPVYTAQAPSCSIWSVPCTACGSSLRAPHKARTRLHLCFVPSLVPAAQAARSLRGALSPGAGRPLPSAAPASVSVRVGCMRAHCVFPAHGCLCFPLNTSQAPAALQGAGPALHAVPVFGYSTKVRIRLRLRFVPSPA